MEGESIEQTMANKMWDLPIFEIKMGEDPKTAMSFRVGQRQLINQEELYITNIIRKKIDGENWFLVFATPTNDKNDYRLVKAWSGDNTYITFQNKPNG